MAIKKSRWKLEIKTRKQKNLNSETTNLLIGFVIIKISDDQTTIYFSIISKQKNKKILFQTWICFLKAPMINKTHPVGLLNFQMVQETKSFS